jgi:uncharacterized protein YfiM (DUF2279 family)
MSNPCNDTWTGKDKVKHFCVCLVLAVICPIVAAVVGIALGSAVHAGMHWLFG